MDAIACRVCNDNISVYEQFLGFRWATCTRCRATQKILTKAQYLDLDPTYDPGMFIDSVASREELCRQLGVEEKSAFLRDKLGGSLAGKEFLDIGCGLGGFLLAAKALGMKASGYEPSAQHCSLLQKYCPNEFVVRNDYFSVESCEQKYDVIIMSHVIEHIYDPRRFLDDVSSCLVEGGVLILLTPNNESLEARITRKRWVMYRPVDHVSLIGYTAAKLLCPSRCELIEASSDEYRGEFAVHILSAVKSLIKGARPAGQLRVGEAPRKQISSSSFSYTTKILLHIATLPFWIIGRCSNSLACLTVVYKRIN